MISMDKKFKAGDRVRAIRSGAVGTVRETSPHVTSVDVSGVIAWFDTDDLVAAPVSTGSSLDLTRRDHFAMAALTGMNVGCGWDASYYARRSYEIADAMEAARNKEGAE